MNVLAIDTASDTLAAALSLGDGGYFESMVDSGLRHSELLIPVIDGLLLGAGLVPRDVGLIVLSGGPGSFTGLRIGFAAARGIAMATGAAMVAVPTLDAVALSRIMPGGAVLAALDAKKGRFYCAAYRGGVRVTPCLDETPENAAALKREGETVLVTGSGAAMIMESLSSRGLQRGFSLDPAYRDFSLRNLIELGSAEFEAGRILAADAGPIYVRTGAPSREA